MLRHLLSIGLAITLGLAFPGCFSILTYEEFDHVDLRTAWVEVIEATSIRVRMVVTTEYEGGRSKQTDIDFNPRLTQCDSVRISRRTASGDDWLTPGTRYEIEDVDRDAAEESEKETRATRVADPIDACSVTLVVSSRTRVLSIAAENSERYLGNADIRSPKDVLALIILLPPTFAVDVVSIPLVLPIMCLMSRDCVIGLVAAAAQVLASEY